MASYAESVDSDSGEDSSRNLVVRLIKLEDQLGLSRWEAWSEAVKVEPLDDADDSNNMMLIEEGGMEWVPVKEEPLDAGETLTYTPMTFSRTDAEGCGDERDITAHACTAAAAVRVAADPSSSVDCGNASSHEAVTIDSAGASVVVVSPHQVHADVGSPATSSHIVVDDSPPRVVSTSPSQEATPMAIATATTTTTAVSPQVPGLGALKIQSPQVSFVTPGTNSGDVGDDDLSSSFLQAADDDDIAMMDISSSQLTVVVDDQMVKGLEDVVVAAATSSPSPRKLAASKRADRLAHKKGKGGRKAGTTMTTTAAVVVKKGKGPPAAGKRTAGKKRGRPPKSASKNPVNVPDSTVTIPGTDGIVDDPDDNHNHHDNDDDDEAPVVPKQRKTKKKATEGPEKGIVPMHPTLGKRIQSGNGTAYNLFRLARLLPNEDGAVEFGQQYDLLPRFRFCPLCGQRLEKLYRIVRQGKRPLYRFQCNKQPCKVGRNQVPLRWGTKFVSSNLSLRKSILLDYCFVKKYDTPTARSETAMPECEESNRMVSTSTETVVDYYNHCREICAFYLMSLPPVGGLGYTVELFQSFFTGSKSHNQGGSKSHKVHAFQGQYVLAGICVETNDVLFAVTPDLDPGTVLPLVQSKVALGTHVRTSACEAYAQLRTFGYEHTVVKDTQLFVHNDLNFSGCSNVTQAGTMRPLAFHRRSGTFNLHLAEYLWRRKSRDSADLFEAYLETVASVYPITIPATTDEQDDEK